MGFFASAAPGVHMRQLLCYRPGANSSQQPVGDDQKRETESTPIEAEVVLKKALQQDVQDYYCVERAIPHVDKIVSAQGREHSAKNCRGNQTRHQNPFSAQESP